MIKQFFKISIKLETLLLTIPDDYLNYDRNSDMGIKFLNKLDKKILITNFYINSILKMLIYDFRNILLKLIKE